MKAAAEPAELEGTVDAPATFEEVSFEMQQRFQQTLLDPVRQIRNERTLLAVFKRLDFEGGLKANEFECRGAACRAVLSFTDVAQAQAVLNNLHKDPDWDRERLGFNALPEDPSKPEQQRYVVYFTSSS